MHLIIDGSGGYPALLGDSDLSCNDFDAEAATEAIRQLFGLDEMKTRVLSRGVG